MISHLARAGILAFVVTASTAGIAAAHTAYDGRWSLSIVTERGTCDRYKFPVEINNGNVSFPGLNKASGRVSAKGGVNVFVSAAGKSASVPGNFRWVRAAAAGPATPAASVAPAPGLRSGRDVTPLGWASAKPMPIRTAGSCPRIEMKIASRGTALRAFAHPTLADCC